MPASNSLDRAHPDSRTASKRWTRQRTTLHGTWRLRSDVSLPTKCLESDGRRPAIAQGALRGARGLVRLVSAGDQAGWYSASATQPGVNMRRVKFETSALTL